MRILVTGASGFIGSHLCSALGSAGHERATGVADCDAVVHLANIAHTGAGSRELHRVNVQGTLAQAQSALRAGARRFVYLSSLKARSPADAYGRAKRLAEEGLLALAGLDPVILRPPLVYGPRVQANFLALMRAIDRGWSLPLASIRNRRSLLYVGNLVDAIVKCVDAPVGGRVFELTDGAPVSTPELCRALGARARASGAAVPVSRRASAARAAPGAPRRIGRRRRRGAAIRARLVAAGHVRNGARADRGMVPRARRLECPAWPRWRRSPRSSSRCSPRGC